MSRSAERHTVVVRYFPGHGRVAAAVAAAAAAWLAASGALVATIVVRPDAAGSSLIFPVAFCGLSLAALWLTRKALALHRTVSDAPAALLEQRHYGRLPGVADGPHPPLRPIGTDALDVARSTDNLLAELIAIPSVRIFRGVRPAGTALPRVSHAVTAARLLILVESVAWPPGGYRTDADHRVRCDGRYIGQSVRPLATAVRRVRRLLPRSHRVSALIVVHRTAEGSYALPVPTRDLAWVLADDLTRYLGELLAHRRSLVSRHTITALASVATEEAMKS
jgi:hypothetical protein